ncbi:MAG: hypothetical protein NT092_02245 [Bacteroidia bacterium]|nr:hypothetical protein [Bacteroidia bacterium]
MENEEKQMTGEESLKIITEMINKTKMNIRQSSFHLLFWGWLIFFCSLSEYILMKFTDFASPWYVWYFTFPGVIVSLVYGFVKGRKESTWTYATMIYVWTWIGFMFASIVLFVIVWKRMESVSPLILTMAAMPTFISGFIIKFRPLIIGAVTFWILALVAHFAGPEIAPLAVPVAMLTGYLIPGYMLKRKESHDAV